MKLLLGLGAVCLALSAVYTGALAAPEVFLPGSFLPEASRSVTLQVSLGLHGIAAALMGLTALTAATAMLLSKRAAALLR